jgi:hypothetical protein
MDRNMDAEKQGRIERFRARIAEANPAGISSRLQHRIEIGEKLIELDEPKLLYIIDYQNSWKADFGAAKSTVYRALNFSTDYDPLP